MRQLTIGVLGIAVLGAGIYVSGSSNLLGGPASAQPWPPFYTMDQLKVVVAPPRVAITPYTMWATYRIRRATGKEEGVPSTSLGGACLLAQIPAGKGCTSDNQCNMDVPSAFGAIRWDGYCLPDQNSLHGDLATNSCWVKPTEAYCHKHAAAGHHEIPDETLNRPLDTKKVYNEAAKYPLAHGKPLKWMVYGCLNGPIKDVKNPPCGGGPGNPMHFKSDIKEVGRVK